MISCFLQGGLGNQLFQISATVSLSLKNNTTYGINMDLCHTPNQGFTANKYNETLFKNINKIGNHHFKFIYDEPKFSFTEIPFKDEMIIRGYFQSDKYFLENKKEIIDLFHIPEDSKTKVLNFFNQKKVSGTTTCVHVRRGDYLKFNDFHSVCNQNYYNQAINLISDSTFILISDDMEWVKKNFNSENFIMFESNNEIDDFTLMTMCDNVIISNSSFSWWGSYLNKNKNKKVIAPNRWFGPSGHKDIEDVYPKDWIRLDF
jgi:hypothetical protein